MKLLQPLRCLGVILLSAIILAACDSKESKTTTEMESTEVSADTLPALDKDSLSSTRPETIKN